MSAAQGPLFRLGSFSAAGEPPVPGLVLGDQVHLLQSLQPLERELGILVPSAGSMLGLLERWPENLPAVRALAEALAARPSATGVPIENLRSHPPVVPRQIFQAGANYHKHVVDLIADGALARDPSADVDRVRADASEMMRKRAKDGKPFIFMGLGSSLTGPCDPIVIPYDVRQADWELELAAVIGAPARRVGRDKALEHVAGYMIANDITARERVPRPDAPQMGMDWMASKGSPTFLPLGPLLTPAEFIEDPQDLRITLKLNGQTMQDESTTDMIFSVARIIEFISAYVQLLPGDLILTGSPSGNGTHYNRFLQPGDVLEGEISGLGRIRNPCIAEGAA
jgi:2-keto-4-pentenoate hydratase/2-oxohepta-3-ene-1,7-dioic acid hydratase in catechol pathway